MDGTTHLQPPTHPQHPPYHPLYTESVILVEFGKKCQNLAVLATYVRIGG